MIETIVTKRTLKRNNTKPWLSTMEVVNVYTYDFQRPCGHTHRCSTYFDTYDEAHAHERWAEENTLCRPCYLAGLSPEAWKLLNWRWYADFDTEDEHAD